MSKGRKRIMVGDAVTLTIYAEATTVQEIDRLAGLLNWTRSKVARELLKLAIVERLGDSHFAHHQV